MTSFIFHHPFYYLHGERQYHRKTDPKMVLFLGFYWYAADGNPGCARPLQTA